MTDDRATIAEQYSRAIGTSHLEVKPTRGDVDLVISAGWAKETLGTLLFRTRTEFDVVRGLLRQADEHRRERSEGETRTDFLLALIELKTLRQTKQALGSFCDKQATLRKVMLDGPAVARIAGTVLESWLDPSCMRCDGRGFTGGYTEAMALCKPCGGTGKRRVRHHDSAAGHDFGRYLLDCVQVKADRAASQIRWSLASQVGGRTDDSVAEVAAAQARLGDMRSADAQMD